MKAIVLTKYGGPEVLQLAEVAKPAPNDDEILVEIHAAAANPLDYHRMRGGPARVAGWLMRIPESRRLGTDVAGRVEAVGQNVTQFQPGDEVFGCCVGSFAEYACARENRVALKPANRSFEEASAVPVAAITALQGLRDAGQVRSGQRVVVNGASGGVGTFAVQLAKTFGAEVTGVCSTRNLDLVRSIGADHVVDYTRKDFTRNGQRYDLIFDAMGNRSVSDYRRALQPQGTCIIAGAYSVPRLLGHLVLAPLQSKTGNRKVRLMTMTRINQKDLVVLKELLEAGKVLPVLDRCYPLRETAEAIGYLEQRHARGKVVITVTR